MDIFLRTIAIIIEAVILAAIAYAIFNGVRLTVFDLGVKAKYSRAISMIFIALGIIMLIFFIAHLTAFYPEV
jgi:succinate dehydrogenase/fumarate reductase cytochrome b subunit